MNNMEKIKMDDILPAEYNPRIMYEQELLHLKNSIENFGLVDPIIINLKNNRIIGGHQRYKILKENDVQDLFLIKLGDIGWAFPEDNLNVQSEDHEKALNIALNKIKGRWDNPKLDAILDDFQTKGFDIELTGFENLKGTGSAFDLDDLIEDNEDDFFNTVFTDMDNIDDLESEELEIKESNIIMQMGDYSIVIDNTRFNYWIRQIEKEKSFNLSEVREELKRRLKL